VNGEVTPGQQGLFTRVQELMDANATEIFLQVESRGILRDVAVSLGLPTDPTRDSTL